MATGSVSDFVSRIRSLLPNWFPDQSDSPVVFGLITGAATALAQAFSLQNYVRLQTRLQTTTDGWLDVASLDFFGLGLSRKNGESDTSFLKRILANLFPEKGTRHGMVRAVTLLTGNAPAIIEPARPQDALCLGHSGLGFGVLGSYQMNNQAFITVYRSASTGGASVAGLGSTYAGLAAPYLAMEDANSLYGAAANSDIYATIEATKPIGSTMWTRITT